MTAHLDCNPPAVPKSKGPRSLTRSHRQVLPQGEKADIPLHGRGQNRPQMVHAFVSCQYVERRLGSTRTSIAWASMPSSLFRHPDRPDDNFQTQQEKEFDRWCTVLS